MEKTQIKHLLELLRCLHREVVARLDGSDALRKQSVEINAYANKGGVNSLVCQLVNLPAQRN